MPRNTANSRQTAPSTQGPSNTSQPRRHVSFEDENTTTQQGKRGKQGNATTAQQGKSARARGGTLLTHFVH